MGPTAGRLVAIAAVLSLGAAGCGGSQDYGRAQAGADAKAGERCDSPSPTAKELVAALPRGWHGEPVDQAVIDKATSDETRSVVQRLTARAVVRRGEPVGAVMVYEFKNPAALAGFFSGFKEKAAEGEEIQLAGGRGTMYQLENGLTSVAGSSGPCAATTVFGAGPEVTRELATELELDPP